MNNEVRTAIDNTEKRLMKLVHTVESSILPSLLSGEVIADLTFPNNLNGQLRMDTSLGK
jgi:hypothetical protein